MADGLALGLAAMATDAQPFRHLAAIADGRALTGPVVLAPPPAAQP